MKAAFLKCLLVAVRQTLHSWPRFLLNIPEKLDPQPQSLKHPTPRRHVEECRLDLWLVIFGVSSPCIWGRLGWPSPPDYDHHDTNFNQQGELRLVSDIAHLQAEPFGPVFHLVKLLRTSPRPPDAARLLDSQADMPSSASYTESQTESRTESQSSRGPHITQWLPQLVLAALFSLMAASIIGLSLSAVAFSNPTDLAKPGYALAQSSVMFAVRPKHKTPPKPSPTN